MASQSNSIESGDADAMIRKSERVDDAADRSSSINQPPSAAPDQETPHGTAHGEAKTRSNDELKEDALKVDAWQVNGERSPKGDHRQRSRSLKDAADDDDLRRSEPRIAYINKHYHHYHGPAQVSNVGTSTGTINQDQKHRDGTSSETKTSASSAAGTTGTVAKWPRYAFNACEGRPATLAFLMALAALNAAPDGTIQTGALALRQRLQTRLVESKLDDGPRLIELPRDREEKLELFRAEAFFSNEDARPVERIRFQDPACQPQVLNYAWTGLGTDFWGNDLIDWMREQGESRDPEARRAVGIATGLLAHRDFDRIFRVLIYPWIKAPIMRSLLAVDRALATAAAHPSLRETVCNNVLRWADSADSDHVLAASALIRGAFGEQHPETAMDGAANLIRQHRALAFAEAERCYVAWTIDEYERGETEPRTLIALRKVTEREAESFTRFQRDHIALRILSTALSDDQEDRAILLSALMTEDARNAAADMVIDLMQARDLLLVHAQMDIATGDLLMDCARVGVRRSVISDPAWTLLGAVLSRTKTVNRKLYDRLYRRLVALRPRLVASRQSNLVPFDHLMMTY